MDLLEKLASQQSRQEFWRYFIAGSLSFAIDFLFLALLAEGAGLHYLLANAISVVAGTTANYALCILWVFSRRRFSRMVVEIPAFLLVCLLGVAINEVFLWFFVSGLAMHHLSAKVLVTGLAFTLNYAMKKVALFS